MTLQPYGQAPYTTASAITTAFDWYRDKGGDAPLTADILIRAGVPESLGNRTMASLKLLDLVDDQGSPTEQFQDFGQIRGEDEYRTRLQEWLRAVYADVLKYCDPSSDQYDKVVEAFRGYEPKGQRRGMATLLLGLWKYAGLPVVASPQASSKSSSAPRPATPRPKPARQPQRSGGRQPAATPAGSPSTDDLPPGLVGLLHQIPRDGKPWTRETRDNFIAAFSAVLDFSVPIGTPTPDFEEDADSEVEVE